MCVCVCVCVCLYVFVRWSLFHVVFGLTRGQVVIEVIAKGYAASACRQSRR